MISLSLSLCGDTEKDVLLLQQALTAFEDQIGLPIKVEISLLLWETYRQEITSLLVHGRLSDVFQAGAPMASDMIAMNALRPFTAVEIEKMGGRNAFVPISWKNASPDISGNVWAIPWLADPRVFFYWRDLFEQAHVNESTAFAHPINFLEAMEQIRESGLSTPYGITVGSKYGALHSVASWIWANGGEFISEDGKRALILEREAIGGFKAYFSMERFVSPEILFSDPHTNYQAFANRQTAVILGNAQVARYILENAPVGQYSYLGAALPFGVPLVGGSNLMVWAKTRWENEAVRLVQFLSGTEVQSTYPIAMGYLPVRSDVLNQSPFTTDAVFAVLVDALQYGHTFPVVQLSGLFEERLDRALVSIWETLLSDSPSDLETLIIDNLAPVAHRYNGWME